jgi:hypothetical protein
MFFFRYIIESYGPKIIETVRSNVRSICPACKPDFRSWNWGTRQRRRIEHICGLTCAEIIEQECEEVIQMHMWCPDQRQCLDKVSMMDTLLIFFSMFNYVPADFSIDIVIKNHQAGRVLVHV